MSKLKCLVFVGLFFAGSSSAFCGTIRGRITDAETGQPLAARLYIQSADKWYFAESTGNGSDARYEKSRNGGKSVEIHTALTPHPFTAEVPPGEYTISVERGKEYRTFSENVTVGEQPVEIDIRLRRWINMSRLGWYSGDTHVHLPLKDLPVFVQAEDLNVAFPLTGWVTKAFDSPEPSYSKQTGKPERELIRVDRTHIIQPMNTEWEIFTVAGKRHTLGAVFAIGHKEPFKIGVPPVRPVADRVRQQGALLELDKHSWPWSMLLLPIMDVDLFELTNNHIWRTNFAFKDWYPEYTAPYMNVEKNSDGGFTERGWIEFGFQNYYSLLNCGFRMRPTAGTASGVHPVPVGFGRVYVELDEFSYDGWINGLNAGRSFVTTGPMLFVRSNIGAAGSSVKLGNEVPAECRLHGRIESESAIDRIEVIVNGRIQRWWIPPEKTNSLGVFQSNIDVTIPIVGSSWIAVRCFEMRADGRVRFAHSSPFHFDLKGRPLRPRKVETAYLVKRIEDELKRHQDVLPKAALDEYREALRFYQTLHETADDP